MESPSDWSACTAVMACASRDDGPEAVALFRCLGLMCSSGTPALAQAIERERNQDHTGPSFAWRVANDSALAEHLTARASQPDPHGEMAAVAVRCFRAGLRMRVCGHCGAASSLLWETGFCPTCGKARTEVRGEATVRLCRACASCEPATSEYCERCGSSLAGSGWGRGTTLQLASDVEHVLRSYPNDDASLFAQSHHSVVGMLVDAANAHSFDAVSALLPLVERLSTFIAHSQDSDLAVHLGPGRLWAVRRALGLLVETARQRSEESAARFVELKRALESRLGPVTIEGLRKSLLELTAAQEKAINEAQSFSYSDDSMEEVLAAELEQKKRGRAQLESPDAPATLPEWLKAADLAMSGRLRLLWLFVPTGDQRSPRVMTLRAANGTARFTVKAGGIWIAGRDKSADLVLPSLMVDKRHAVLDFLGTDCLVHDAGSTSGTFLNDLAVRAPTALRMGDRLRVGGYALIVEQYL